SLSSTPRAARCSTVPPAPSGVTQLTGAPAIRSPVFADTLTACQSCCGDHHDTMRSPAGKRPATCSTRNGPLRVCQLVTPAITCWPVFALTFTTCQSCCGDHQKTRSSFSGLAAPMCSTLKGPLVVCQLVGGPAALGRVRPLHSTIPGSITNPFEAYRHGTGPSHIAGVRARARYCIRGGPAVFFLGWRAGINAPSLFDGLRPAASTFHRRNIGAHVVSDSPVV